MRYASLFVVFLLTFTAVATGQNYKIKQTVTMSGQRSESTVYVKGQRKRTESGGFMGMGADVADIEQCDLRRDVKVNDKKRLYVIEPFDDDNDEPSAPVAAKRPAPTPKPSPRKGGTLTVTTNTVDTGERKQMFGLTARHIRMTMTMKSSPDACSKMNMSAESDGWYVDLPAFSCAIRTFRRPETADYQRSSSGCRDRVVAQSTGGGKMGFALTETYTMNSDGGMAFTRTTETLEFSKVMLDDALFNIPADYSQANSSSDLYGRPDLSSIIGAGAGNNDGNNSQTKPTITPPLATILQSNVRRPGVIRIGVFVPTNRSGENVTGANLQSFLIQRLGGGNVEAIGVADEGEARMRDCDYTLASDISKLKQSTAGKIGGLLGKVTNTDASGAGSFDAQVEFVLTSLKDGRQTKSKAGDKSQSKADRAAEAVLQIEANTVLNSIRQ